MTFSLATDRLILEDLGDADLAGIRRIARDPAVMRYVLLWLEDDEQVARFVRHAAEEAKKADRMAYVLAIRVKETGDFAGFALLEIDPEQRSTAEAGCVLLPEYWNAGYAPEVLRAFLSFGFAELALHRIFGKCDELNYASARVLEKCGLSYEGTLREHVWLRDHWRSTRYYGILHREYRDPKGPGPD